MGFTLIAMVASRVWGVMDHDHFPFGVGGIVQILFEPIKLSGATSDGVAIEDDEVSVLIIV